MMLQRTIDLAEGILAEYKGPFYENSFTDETILDGYRPHYSTHIQLKDDMWDTIHTAGVNLDALFLSESIKNICEQAVQNAIRAVRRGAVSQSGGVKEFMEVTKNLADDMMVVVSAEVLATIQDEEGIRFGSQDWGTRFDQRQGGFLLEGTINGTPLMMNPYMKKDQAVIVPKKFHKFHLDKEWLENTDHESIFFYIRQTVSLGAIHRSLRFDFPELTNHCLCGQCYKKEK